MVSIDTGVLGLTWAPLDAIRTGPTVGRQTMTNAATLIPTQRSTGSAHAGGAQIGRVPERPPVEM